MSIPRRLPSPLQDFFYKQKAVCHEHAGVLAALQFICWWTCHVLISLWILLVSCFTEGLCRRQLTQWWECRRWLHWLICVGRCVGAEQDWVLSAFQKEVHCSPLKRSLCRLGGE